MMLFGKGFQPAFSEELEFRITMPLHSNQSNKLYVILILQGRFSYNSH